MGERPGGKQSRYLLGAGLSVGMCLNVASAVERDVQKMFPRAGRVAHEDTMMDDDGQYIHLVGPGKYVKVEETFVNKLHVLEEFFRGIGRNEIAAGLQMASRPVSVHVFQRAQIELRCSIPKSTTGQHHVVLITCVTSSRTTRHQLSDLAEW